MQRCLMRAPRLICIVAKSHDEHVFRALRTTLEENLAMVADNRRPPGGQRRRVFVDCEHFFDGYKANPDYALEVIRAAADAALRSSCCATRMAACCRRRWAYIVSAASAVGVDLVSTVTTTPAVLWPTPWPPSMPA